MAILCKCRYQNWRNSDQKIAKVCQLQLSSRYLQYSLTSELRIVEKNNSNDSHIYVSTFLQGPRGGPYAIFKKFDFRKKLFGCVGGEAPPAVPQ